jgi:hypothetical protein
MAINRTSCPSRVSSAQCCAARHASSATTVAGSLSKKGGAWARIKWRRAAACSLASTP